MIKISSEKLKNFLNEAKTFGDKYKNRFDNEQKEQDFNYMGGFLDAINMVINYVECEEEFEEEE